MIRLAVFAAAFALAACGAPEEAPQPPEPPITNGEVETAGALPGDTGGMCGGFANVACVEAADYCAVPMVLAANPNATGVCTPRPQVCTRDYRPHCGADGRTYSNACVAASEGVNVVSAGYCPGDEPETEGK